MWRKQGWAKELTFRCQLPLCHCSVPSQHQGLEQQAYLGTQFEGTCVLPHSYSYTLHQQCGEGKAVPRLTQFLTGLSPQRPRFNSRLVHVGSLADKVALGQVSLQVCWLSHRQPNSAPLIHLTITNRTQCQLLAATLNNTLTKLLGRVMLCIQNSVLEVPLTD